MDKLRPLSFVVSSFRRSTVFLASVLVAACTLPENGILSCALVNDKEGVLEVSADPEIVEAIIRNGLTRKYQSENRFYKSHGFINLNQDQNPVNILTDIGVSHANPSDIILANPGADAFVLAGFPFGESVSSARYYSNGAALDYRAEFVIVISEAQSDGHTIVDVVSHRAFVLYGKELNLHALGIVAKSYSVPPAREEEYILLTYIASLLGRELQTLDDIRRSRGTTCDEVG